MAERDVPAPDPTRGTDDIHRPGDQPDIAVAHDSRSAGDEQQPAHAPRMLSASRYLAWLYSPAPQQPVFARLCEIESEIAGSLRPGIDHHVAHARLQWWREECERCALGRPVHPLTRELAKAYGTATAGAHSPTPAEAQSPPPAIAHSLAPAQAHSPTPTPAHGLSTSARPSPLAGISGFADTAVWDLAGATFETRKELTAYCERWAAAMFETLAATVPSSAATSHRSSNAPPSISADRSPWRVLGAAVREIELLTDLAREAHAGRLRVPLDELDRAGIDVKSLANPPWPAPLATLLRERHQALRATLTECVGPLGREEREGFRGLLVWAALAWRQSARAQNALPNIISPRRYHAVADGWLAWRSARRATARNFRLS